MGKNLEKVLQSLEHSRSILQTAAVQMYMAHDVKAYIEEIEENPDNADPDKHEILMFVLDASQMAFASEAAKKMLAIGKVYGLVDDKKIGTHIKGQKNKLSKNMEDNIEDLTVLKKVSLNERDVSFDEVDLETIVLNSLSSSIVKHMTSIAGDDGKPLLSDDDFINVHTGMKVLEDLYGRDDEKVKKIFPEDKFMKVVESATIFDIYKESLDNVENLDESDPEFEAMSFFEDFNEKMCLAVAQDHPVGATVEKYHDFKSDPEAKFSKLAIGTLKLSYKPAPAVVPAPTKRKPPKKTI